MMKALVEHLSPFLFYASTGLSISETLFANLSILSSHWMRLLTTFLSKSSMLPSFVDQKGVWACLCPSLPQIPAAQLGRFHHNHPHHSAVASSSNTHQYHHFSAVAIDHLYTTMSNDSSFQLLPESTQALQSGHLHSSSMPLPPPNPHNAVALQESGRCYNIHATLSPM